MRRFALPLALLLSLAGCAPGPGPRSLQAGAADVRIRTSRGTVELRSLPVASTPEERARGLMGRTSLPDGDGMVFVFDGPTRDAFWMKDTLIPLSIAFWNRGGRIVDILDMQPCRQAPCSLYRPSGSYVAALEARLGFFRRHRVANGDRVELEPLGG